MFASQRGRLPLGLHVHTVLAVCACFCASWPTSVPEVTAVVILIFAAIRLRKNWWMFGAGFGQSAAAVVIAFAAWQTLSLAWSPDRGQGLDELNNLRWWLWMVVLWPVLEHRRWLIGALACGFVAGHATQIAQAIGRAQGIEWLIFERASDRNSGWWHPVVAGTILVGALGLHLPSAIMGHGRVRWLSAGACIATVAGIVATGTRGAWVGTAGLIGLVALFAIVRRGRRGWATAAAASALVTMGGAIGWAAFGSTVGPRVTDAIREARAAIQSRDYGTSLGGRIAMMRLAFDAFAAHPVAGVGVGGFRHQALLDVRRRGWDPENVSIHDHAHCTPLHIAATTGGIGLLIAGMVAATGLRGGFTGLGRDRLGTYDAGPAFALAGLLLAGFFDTLHVASLPSSLMAILMALCMPARPPERAWHPLRISRPR